MADSDPKSLKPQKAGIRMMVFPCVLIVITVFALGTEAISYLYLTVKETSVLLLKVLQVFVLCGID